MIHHPPLTQAVLRQFTGTQHWYRHPLVREVVFTDGARYVADAGGACWLLDEIAFAQRAVPAVAAEEFQSWTLTVHENRTALLVCGNGNRRTLYSKKLEYTDFPLAEITLYCSNRTILLPSEY